MGNMPNCTYFSKTKQIISKSEVIIKDFENIINLSKKEIKDKSNYNIDKKDENENTLSSQNYFINPLPEIVIVKFKKL